MVMAENRQGPTELVEEKFEMPLAQPIGGAGLHEPFARILADRLEESESTSASTGTDASASGSDNEGTRQTVSPDTPSASRLVARIRNAGAPRSRASTSSAQAAAQCSQVSSTRSSAR